MSAPQGPLQDLRAELDRTAVISREFKQTIMAWAHEIARDAFERGRAEGREAVQTAALDWADREPGQG